MGMLVEGVWSDAWYEPDAKGRFVRPETRFRGRLTADGSSGHPAESGRYHLYVSYACPWAHRTLILRKIKGLEDAISVSVVSPDMAAEGWTFEDHPGVVADPIHGASHLWKVYVAAQADYTGRVTVPILWDRERATIVNNESREIMRMLDTELDAIAGSERNVLPAEGTAPVDAVLDAIYEPINNGVYRSGFARTQEAYEEAVGELFDALDHWDEVLGGQRFLCGNTLTEADVAMYTTLVRFDLVYHGHFKCNRRRIQDYPNLWPYLRDLYQRPAFRETTHFDHIKRHYYWSHETINPTRVVPVGPEIDFDAPHDRDRFAGG